MSAKIFTLILVASQLTGLAADAASRRHLLDEDRYMYAQPQDNAAPFIAQPHVAPRPDLSPRDGDRESLSNSNGS